MITVDKRRTRHCLGCRVHVHRKATPAVYLVRDGEKIIGDIRPIKKRWGRHLEHADTFYSAWIQLPSGFLRFLGNSYPTIEDARDAFVGGTP